MVHRRIILLAVLVTWACPTVLCAGQVDLTRHFLTFDLRDAPLDEALRQVFQDTGYSYTLDPGLGDLRVTITLRQVTFGQALRAIVYMHDLTYEEHDGVYRIVQRGAGPPPGREEEPLVSLDLEECPVADALKLLFRQTRYQYEYEYPEMPDEFDELEDTVTLSVSAAPFTETLREMLGQLGLTSWQEDGTYIIAWAEAETRWEALQAPSPGKFGMLYLTDYGGRQQLRLRIFPYPGRETILWESRDRGRRMRYLPSPSLTRVLIADDPYSQTILLLDPATGDVEDITDAVPGRPLLWRDDTALRVLDSQGKEWAYDVGQRQASLVTDHRAERRYPWDSDILSVFESAFAEGVGVLRDLVEDSDLLLPFDEDDIVGAFGRGAGIPYHPSPAINIPRAFPVAALSPDGRYLALTTGRSQYAVFVIYANTPAVARVIPLSRLVSDENVWVSDLRWSADSEHLVFTEVHYHPAQFYAPDFGPRPDPLDWTNLIRMYTLKGDEARTVAVGRQPFLIPSHLEEPAQDR